ncbi:MAG: hypothetical protein ACXACA_00515 [Candidatus Ranarchaeia archaeon]|jgi:hypothetical protein
MVKESTRETSTQGKNKYFVGPGLGLFAMGLLYLVFWLTPVPLETFAGDPRWAHNWAYSIILITIGAAFYQKSVVSRSIAFVQGLMMPITASGVVHPIYMTIITVIIAVAWFVVTVIERYSKKLLLKERLSTRAWNWVNLHSLLVCWLLIAHMGLVFFLGRLPFEAELSTISTSLGHNIGFLWNLPPERYELVTYIYDINLLILSVLYLYEQYKMGYNFDNKPWPKWSFWFTVITLIVGIVIGPVSLKGILWP